MDRGIRRLVVSLALLAAAAVCSAGDSPRWGRTILALYKSTDGQSEKDNEIASSVEPILRELGFAVRYHDADGGVPDAAALQGVRAVVSWFRGPAMASPERYLAFVRETIDSGRKFIALDNLGAYQERSSGRWLESGELNLTLSRFGLQYWGDWTDDPALVTIRAADAEVVRAEALRSSGVRMLFYRYIPVDRDLDVLLSVERRDRSYGPSPVVVANRNGAFVLSSYISAFRNGALEMYIDLGALLRRALFGRPREERVAILADDGGGSSQAVRIAERVLGVGKIGADVVRPPDLGFLVPGDLTPYTTVVLALADSGAVDDRVIGEYLGRGGSLVCLSDGLPESVRRVASASARGEEPAAVEARGFRFTSGFLPSEGFFLEDREVPWTVGTLRPPSGAALVATDWLDASPLLWSLRAPAGGTILVWNARDLWRPEHAGLMMESFLAARPVAACLTPGLAALRLDGFPRPLYNMAQASLGVTDTQFYTMRFWPELRDLLGRRGIPLSASVLFNYNDRTSPPFWGGEMYMAERQAAVELARQVVASGAEMGLFGYNHVSLATTQSGPNLKSWPSRQPMEEALRGVRADWELLFGKHALPRSYAAPYGIVSSEGLAALGAVFPELRAVGTSVAANGSLPVGFAPAPGTPRARLEPAATSGYLFTDAARRMVVSSALGEGVWVHALDADDVLDPSATGGKKWEDLKAELDRLLAFAARHYPWLRFVTVSALASELDRLEDVRARYELLGESSGQTTFSIEAPPGTLFRLRSPGLRIQTIEGGELVYGYGRADAAVLRSLSGRVVVRLSRKT